MKSLLAALVALTVSASASAAERKTANDRERSIPAYAPDALSVRESAMQSEISRLETLHVKPSSLETSLESVPTAAAPPPDAAAAAGKPAKPPADEGEWVEAGVNRIVTEVKHQGVTYTFWLTVKDGAVVIESDVPRGGPLHIARLVTDESGRESIQVEWL